VHTPFLLLLAAPLLDLGADARGRALRLGDGLRQLRLVEVRIELARLRINTKQ
jgi:hypothetical protein